MHGSCDSTRSGKQSCRVLIMRFDNGCRGVSATFHDRESGLNAVWGQGLVLIVEFFESRRSSCSGAGQGETVKGTLARSCKEMILAWCRYSYLQFRVYGAGSHQPLLDNTWRGLC